MRKVPSLETVYRDYSPQGVRFAYVYKSLAHPGYANHVQPFTLEERLTHIAHAKKELRTEIPWICDNMENSIKHGFGNRNNSEFVISPEGKIVHARAWSDPEQLRDDLAELVGEVSPATSVAALGWDADRPVRPPNRRDPDRLVQRIPRPSGSVPLKVTPTSLGAEAAPYYVKLRAEGTRELIEKGEGSIHLSFRLDPIHQVHWNNLAKPIHVELSTTSGTVSPSTLDGPTVEAMASDREPREFLIEVTDLETNPALKLKVDYFACHDVEEWGRAVSQSYLIALEHDRDAGTVSGGNRQRGSRRTQGGFGNPNGPPEPGRPSLQRLPVYRVLDHDGDGALSSEEVQQASDRLRDLDEDGDGLLSPSEWLPRGGPPDPGERGRRLDSRD